MFRTPPKQSVKDEEDSRSEEKPDEKKADDPPKKPLERPPTPPKKKEKEEKKRKEKKKKPSDTADDMGDAKSDEWMRVPERLTILTKDNYARWKYDITVVLQVRELVKMTNGEEKLPARPAEGAEPAVVEKYMKDYKAWIQRDARAKEILTRSLDGRHHDMIRNCTTAYGIAKTLMSMYEQKSSTNLFLVQREYHECHWTRDMTALEFIAKVKIITNKLDTLGEKVSDTMIMSKIVNEMPQSYNILKETWEVAMLSSTSTLSLQDLTAQLIRHENRTPKKQSDTGKEKKPDSGGALVVKHKVKQRKAKGKGCYTCGKEGHFSADCFQNDANKKQTAGGRNSFHMKGNQQSGGQHKPSAKIADGKERANAGFVVSMVMADDALAEVWIADSGATSHMTNKKHWFEELILVDNGPVVYSAGKEQTMQVKGIGRIRINILEGVEVSSAYLNDVWYIPDLADLNLFSIARAEAKDCYIGIADGVMRISGKQGRLRAERNDDGLYILNISTEEPPHTDESEDTPHCYSNAAVAVTSLKKWHERFCHISADKIKQMAGSGAVTGLPQKLVNDTCFCEGCVLGKMTRTPCSDAERRRSKPGEYLHSDLCGKMEVESLGGNLHFALFKDEATAFRLVYPIATKDKLYDKLRQVVRDVADQTGQMVKRIRSDHGKEFESAKVQQFLEDNDIIHEYSAIYVHEQNGMAERENRTLTSLARSMLEARGLPKKLWAEAVATAAYTMNRIPNRDDEKTPYEMWFGKKPDVSHLRIFGCPAYRLIDESQRKKWDPKAQRMIFVGYDVTTKNYRLWDEETNRVITCKHVSFDEDAIVTSIQKQPEVRRGPGRPRKVPVEAVGEPARLAAADKEFVHGDELALATLTDPQSVEEALGGPDHKEWMSAMQKEIASQAEKNTWELTDLPTGKKAIDCKWIFRVKYNTDGSLDKRKARIVARGFSQRPGIDYAQTFSPVIRYESIRILLSIAANENLEVEALDVVTAFLNGEVQEELYMKQPPCFDDGTGRVCRLIKSLYGLKQAPKEWNRKLTAFLKSIGLIQSEVDPCVFMSPSGQKRVILGIYVDDGILCCESKEMITEILQQLNSEFEITHKPLSQFVGMEVTRVRDKGVFFVSQAHYIEKMLETFQMVSCKGQKTPGDYHSKLTKEMSPASPEEKEKMREIPYRELVGSLMFCAVTTRPDIAFAVAQVSQFNSNPGEKHWIAAKRILRYLQETKRRRSHPRIHSGRTDRIL